MNTSMPKNPKFNKYYPETPEEPETQWIAAKNH